MGRNAQVSPGLFVGRLVGGVRQLLFLEELQVLNREDDEGIKGKAPFRHLGTLESERRSGKGAAPNSPLKLLERL